MIPRITSILLYCVFAVNLFYVLLSSEVDEVKRKVDDCNAVLHEQRQDNSPSDRSDFVESFSDLEFDVLVQGRFNISVPNCFGSISPYFQKDFCIFECPFIKKQKNKLSYTHALSDFQQLSKSMQKVSSLIPRYNHRIAVVTSSYAASQGGSFYDIVDSNSKSVDRFDLKGDLNYLPNIVANYRYIAVDLQQHTVCAQLIIQLIYFSKRTVLIPSINPSLSKYSEIAPYVLQLSDNRISNRTFSYLFRHATENHLQALASFRFAMNFLSLKRRCTNLRHYQHRIVNITEPNTTVVLSDAHTSTNTYNNSMTFVASHSLLKPGRAHHTRASRHSRLRHNRNNVEGTAMTSPSNSNTISAAEAVVTGKIQVVLSHLEGDFHATNISWLVGYDHLILDRTKTARLSSSDPSVEGHLHIVDVDPEERGSYVADYLRFIISNYQSLPDTMIFSHTSSSSYSVNISVPYSLEDLHHDIFYLIEDARELRLENNGFAFLGNTCYRFFEQLPVNYHGALHGYFAQWLEFPLNRWYIPGGYFVVSKTAVLRRSLDSYMTLLRLVDYKSALAAKSSVPIEFTLLDMTWPSVFRSSCVVGNHDDCILKRQERCGLKDNDAVSESLFAS